MQNWVKSRLPVSEVIQGTLSNRRRCPRFALSLGDFLFEPPQGKNRLREALGQPPRHADFSPNFGYATSDGDGLRQISKKVDLKIKTPPAQCESRL